MINYMNHDGNVNLQFDGNLETIIAETAYLILLTYKELLKKNGCVAEIYREFFENSKDIFDFDAAQKKDTEDIESCEKAMIDMLDALENALKNRKKGGDENA